MENEMRQKIYATLVRLGCKCTLSGFSYIAYGAELVIQDPELIRDLCRKLYPKIAENFGVSSGKCVERSIRHCINRAQERGGFESLNNCFGAKIYSPNKPITSGEFIKLVADIYNLDLCDKIGEPLQENISASDAKKENWREKR